MGMISGHDTQAAVFKGEEFFNAIKDGSFPPRWSKRLDFGLGQPTFTFTYSMPYYLMSAIMFLNSGPIWAFKIVMAASFPCGAFFTFLWLKKHFGGLPAFLASLLYAYLPYHFANVYVRGDIGETVAAAWLPLAFWGLDRVIDSPTPAKTAVAALTVAAVIISHPFYGLVFGAIWTGYILLRSRKNIQALKMAMTALIWGYVCCAFYIIPSLVYKNMTFLSRLESYFIEKQYFVTLDRIFYSPWGFDGANELDRRPMSVQAGLVAWGFFTGWLGIALLSKKVRKDRHFYEGLYFSMLTVAAVFLMLSISLPVWKLLSPMENLQFPWRLLFVVNIGMTYLAGFVLRYLAGILKQNKIKLLVFTGLAGLIIIASRSYWSVGRYFPYVDLTREAIGYPGTLTMLLEETPVWHSRNQEANPHNFIQNAEGRAILLTMLVWKTNYHKFLVVTDKPIAVNDKTHFWPGWKVWVDGVASPTLDPFAKISQGLITFRVGPGTHIVETRLTETGVEQTSDSISLISIFGAVAISLPGVLRLKRHDTV